MKPTATVLVVLLLFAMLPIGGSGNGNSSWLLTGNTNTDPTSNFLGTTDDQALELRVRNQRGLRLEPIKQAVGPFGGHEMYVNVICGAPSNSVTDGAKGVTISGGGYDDYTGFAYMNLVHYFNRVTDDFCTIGGGYRNVAGDDNKSTKDAVSATVAGGEGNAAGAIYAAVGGGKNNLAHSFADTIGGGQANSIGPHQMYYSWSTIGGGHGNEIVGATCTISGGSLNTIDVGLRMEIVGVTIAGGSGNSIIGACDYSTVGGGQENKMTDRSRWCTIGGGWNNKILGGFVATIGGGEENEARGAYATVPGGRENEANGNYSFAAGRRAKAEADGCFVWGDSTAADVTASKQNQFIVRASGGVISDNYSSRSTTIRFPVCRS